MNVDYEYPSKKFEKVTITLTANEAHNLLVLLKCSVVDRGSTDVGTSLIRALENPQP